MICSTDADVVLCAVFFMLIIVFGIISFHQCQLDISGCQLLQQIGCVAEVQLNIGFWMMLLESCQRLDDRVFADGHGHT